MRPFFAVFVGVCLLSGGTLRPGPPRRTLEQEGQREAAAEQVIGVAEERPGRRDPGDRSPRRMAPPHHRQRLLTTMAARLYDHYAEKCGSDTVREKNFTSVGRGQGRAFMIVDRVPGAAPGYIFSLRAKEYTVTVTIHPAPTEGRPRDRGRRPTDRTSPWTGATTIPPS